jgi:sodium/bile acid cotransporter 7
MVVSLAVLVVLPIIAAQMLRLAAPLGRWATAQKIPLGVLAQTGILTMVFLGAIQTGIKLSASGLSAVWIDLTVMLVAVVGIHLAALGLGIVASRLAGFAREDAIAVGFAGSQKTLMVGLEACAQLGITILPMVAYHVGQLLADTVVAQRLSGGQNTGATAGLPRKIRERPERAAADSTRNPPVMGLDTAVKKQVE